MRLIMLNAALLPAYSNCGTASFLYAFLVWVIILVALVAIVRLLMPYLGGILGPPWPQVLSIVGWVIVALAALKLVFLLFSCVV